MAQQLSAPPQCPPGVQESIQVTGLQGSPTAEHPPPHAPHAQIVIAYPDDGAWKRFHYQFKSGGFDEVRPCGWPGSVAACSCPCNAFSHGQRPQPGGDLATAPPSLPALPAPALNAPRTAHSAVDSSTPRS